MRIKSYETNIFRDYVYTAFHNMNLTRGLWMIYLASKGFTLVQLGILESVYHITSFLMEIPTGAVADLVSRKASRFTGRLFYLVSLLILFMSRSFPVQMTGFIICAIGNNLESGAGEALLYDSLSEDSRDTRYMAIAGKKEFIFQASSICALLAGGYLATRDYNYVFIISIITGLLSLAAACSFVEPPIGRKPLKGESITERLRNQTIGSFKVIRERRQLAFYIIFSELIFTFTVSLFFYLQNFWKGIGYSEFHIGLIFAASALFSGISSLMAHGVEKRIGGERGLILIIPVVLISALWGMALSPWKFPFYLLIGFMEGLLLVAISDYINRLIPPEYRATVLSFQSMAYSFFMIILFPLIGWAGERFGLEKAFLLITLAASLFGLLYYIYHWKRSFQNKVFK